MNIGIIGAGQIGGTLTRRLTALGHTVAVANSAAPKRSPTSPARPAQRAVSVTDAVRDKDLIIVTIPQKNIPDLPPGCFTTCPTPWLSWRPATTIRGSATAASTGSKPA